MRLSMCLFESENTSFYFQLGGQTEAVDKRIIEKVQELSKEVVQKVSEIQKAR